jgi:hypothetical protein
MTYQQLPKYRTEVQLSCVTYFHGESNICQYCQEIWRTLWNKKVQYHIQNCLPLIREPSQMNPVHILYPSFFEMHINIIPSSMPKEAGIVQLVQ